MVMVTKMETDGNKNEDRLKSLETDFSNSNFSPEMKKERRQRQGLVWKLIRKKIVSRMQNKKIEILERRCGAKFGESRPSQRAGHARKTSCRAKKQTGALARTRRDKVELFVPCSSVWRWSCLSPPVL